MITNPPRTILAAVLTVTSLSFAAGSVAHAEPNSGGSTASSGMCGSMENGEVRTYKRRYERGTITCRNGTRCETRKVKQGNGSWKTFKECKKVPAMDRTTPQGGGRAPVTDAAASPAVAGTAAVADASTPPVSGVTHAPVSDGAASPVATGPTAAADVTASPVMGAAASTAMVVTTQP